MKKNILFFISLFIIQTICIANYTNTKTALNNQAIKEIKFTENKGQLIDMNGQPISFVLFKVEVPGMSMYITEKGLTYMPFSIEEEEEYERKNKHKIEKDEKFEIKYSRIDMELKDASIKRENIITEEKSMDEKRYFLGHCPKGITDVHSYKKITIKNIYPNIDWVLYNSTEKGLKYDFILHPGANHEQIKLLYRSKHKPNINKEGAIEIKTKQGNIVENAPYSYLKNSNTEIKSSFIKTAQISCSPTGVDRGYETEISFNIQKTNLTQLDDLIIDPQLTWSTYIGSNSIDGIMCSAVDNSGNFYVAGYTADNGYPTQAWGTAYFDNTINNPVGYGDVFLSKFSSVGILLWSTYYGGDNSEEAHSMTIDQSGNIYVVGSTSSTNLPAQSFGAAYYDNSFNSTQSFNSDIFILRFSATGNLDWATYYGGDSRDDARCVTTDATGNVYITGFSQSFNFPLLNLGGAYFYNTSIFGTILLKFSPTGVLTWATVFQSSNFSTSYGESVVVDNSNNLYLLGETTGNLVTVNPGNGAYFDNTAGINDAFIAKFNSAGVLTWSTYLGGNDNVEYIYSARVDASNNLVVLGSTKSTDFPTQSNGSAYFDNTFAGGPNGGDMFISKFTSAGALTWSTYFGGSQDEMLGGGAGDTRQQLAIDKCDNIYAAFSTTSSDIATLTNSCAPFYRNALQNQDNFITKFTNTGALEWATYFGGIGTDLRTQIIIDNSNNIYLSGEWNLGGGASDATYTFVNPGGGAYFQNTNGGSDDSFMMKIEPSQNFTSSQVNPNGCGGNDGTATITVNCSNGLYNYTWSNNIQTLNSSSNTNTVTGLSAGTYTVTVDYNCGTFTETYNISGGISTITITTSSIAASCGLSNGSATITPSPVGSYIYTWSGAASGQTAATANNLSAGTYTVTLTDGGGCNTTTTVTVSSTGGATINSVTKNNALCFGGNGNATVNISGGVSGNYTYSWSNGASTVTTATSNQQLLTANSYTVTVIDGACSTTSVVNITQPSAITFGTPTINNASCGIINGSATVAASGGTGALGYSWSATETSATINNKASGNYVVTITDANSCSATLAVNIGNTGGATISSVIKNNALCFGGNGNATVNISGGVSGNYTYSWSNGPSTVTTVTSNTELLTANSYTVTVIDGACSATTVVSITQPAPLAIGINKTNASCNINNGSITTSASNGTANYTFLWSSALGYNNNANSSGVNIINNLTADTYSLIVTDNNNCTASTSVIIVNSGNPNANASATAYEIDEGASTLLAGSGGVGYLWIPPTALSCAACPNPIANPSITTTYTLIIRDVFGCIDSTDITIKVNKSCTDEKDVFIANVFSPNNDGKNDELKIEGSGLTNIYWSIYDRWGNLIFETLDQTQAWDGTKNGNPMGQGTYVYYLKATCKKTQQEIILKGNVSVVK